MTNPIDKIIIDPTGLPYGVIACEECENECAATGPAAPENCPHCGAYLWEDDEPDDLPRDISTFSREV